MALLTQDQVVQGLAESSRQIVMLKNTLTAAAGSFVSLWLSTGAPTAGVAPTTAAIPTRTTTGALNAFQSNAAAGKGLYVAGGDVVTVNNTTPQFYVDRLAHMGGLSGTVTTAQTVNVSVNSLKGTRCKSDCTDVTWWIEIYTAIGASASTATISYTRDSDGTAGRTVTMSLGTTAANQASRMLMIFPQAGEVIRSIESITLSVTTGTAGNFGVTAQKPLFTSSNQAAYAMVSQDWMQTKLARINNDACVSAYVLAGLTTTGIITGTFPLIEV